MNKTDSDTTTITGRQHKIMVSAITFLSWIGTSIVIIYAERALSTATYYKLNFNIYHIGPTEVTGITFIFATIWIVHSVAISVWLQRYLKSYSNYILEVQ